MQLLDFFCSDVLVLVLQPTTHFVSSRCRSVRVAERLALPTSDHGVAGSNPAGGEILPEPKRRFIAQSLSCSPFHRLEMTKILLKGRKTLTHPSNHHLDVDLFDLLFYSPVYTKVISSAVSPLFHDQIYERYVAGPED